VTPQSPVVAEPSVWRSRSFQLLWAARTVSLTGSAVTLVVLPILVFQRTGSPLIANLTTVRTAYLVMAAVALVAASGAWLSPLRRSSATLTPGDTPV